MKIFIKSIERKDKTKSTGTIVNEVRQEAKEQGLILTSRMKADIKYVCKGKGSQSTVYYCYKKEDE